MSFRMPAEWEPHTATWLAWPHQRDDWPGKFAPIPWVYVDIIRHLHTGELVHLVVPSAAAEKRICPMLRKAGVDLGRVQFFHFPTDRSWIRDSGPTFVTDTTCQVRITAWQFNAWAKYANFQHDEQLPARMAASLGLPLHEPRWHDRRVVLEGGSIEVNGAGLLLTTEECLLSDVQARNPGLGRAEYEAILQAELGIDQVLWLGKGIVGDDTHGHVDDLARFVNHQTVVTVVEQNAADANHEILQDNLRRLQVMTDQAGRRLDVVPLPMPGPVVFAKQRLPASYANFYIANTKVLVPTFNDPSDRIALGILAELFPTREVVGIHSLDLVWGLGTLHCMTQQQPAPLSVDVR